MSSFALEGKVFECVVYLGFEIRVLEERILSNCLTKCNNRKKRVFMCYYCNRYKNQRK